MNIRKIVEQTLDLTGSGRSADIAAKALLVNLLKDDLPFHTIELKNIQHLVLMMRDADKPHIYGENSIFYFTAHYSYSDDYPVGRSYFIKQTNLLEIGRMSNLFESQGLRLPIIPPQKLDDVIDNKGFRDRIQTYKSRKEREWAPFKDLFEGRKESTIVESSMFMNSPGCLICGSKNYLMMTSTINSGTGTMLGFNLCQNHLDESKKHHSLIEYLAHVINHPLQFHTQPLDTSSHLAMIISWLPKAISAKIDNVKENTVTLIRKSRFRLILRLDSLSDYAYVIKNPDDKEVARFDSADHHDIPYGPSHLHPNLPKDKSVRSSFTTGTPVIDVPAILAILKEKENDFKGKS